jgi:hypothetical protein
MNVRQGTDLHSTKKYPSQDNLSRGNDIEFRTVLNGQHVIYMN